MSAPIVAGVLWGAAAMFFVFAAKPGLAQTRLHLPFRKKALRSPLPLVGVFTFGSYTRQSDHAVELKGFLVLTNRSDERMELRGFRFRITGPRGAETPDGLERKMYVLGSDGQPKPVSLVSAPLRLEPHTSSPTLQMSIRAIYSHGRVVPHEFVRRGWVLRVDDLVSGKTHDVPLPDGDPIGDMKRNKQLK